MQELFSIDFTAFLSQFEKIPFALSDLMQMKQNGEFPPIILYAAPVMVFFVILEIIVSQYVNRKSYYKKDTWACVGVGAGYLVSTALVQVAQMSFILFFYKFALWTIPMTWWSFILCIFVIDFCRYWAHRFAHEQRFWWTTHVTHHSSEYFNLSVAFRLSWIQHPKIVFFTPVALLGFHPVLFFIANQVTILYQFWCHTEYIGKMPKFISYFFVTPSHHRVHHGVNPKYLDRNYGSTFIIWDRVFGTFQPEEETPTYGITQPIKSFNPFYINFHELIDLVKELRKSPNWSLGWKMLWSPPGSCFENGALIKPDKGPVKLVEMERIKKTRFSKRMK